MTFISNNIFIDSKFDRYILCSSMLFSINQAHQAHYRNYCLTPIPFSFWSIMPFIWLLHTVIINHDVWIKYTLLFLVGTLITHLIKVYLISQFQHGSSNPVRDLQQTIGFLYLRKTLPNQDLNSGLLEIFFNKRLLYHRSFLALCIVIVFGKLKLQITSG